MKYFCTLIFLSSFLFTFGQDQLGDSVLFREWNVLSANETSIVLSPIPAELGTQYENWTFRKNGILEIYAQNTSSGTYNILEFVKEDRTLITDSVYVEGNSNATFSNTSTFSLVGNTVRIRIRDSENSYSIARKEEMLVLTRVH